MIDVQRQGVTYMHLTTMLGSQTPRRQASSASTLINPRHQWHISSRLPSQSRASSEPSNAGPSTSGRDASAAQPPMKLPPQHAPLTAQPMLHSPRAEASAAGEANPGRAPAPESMLGFDPNLGKGFAPPPGGAPLWWAEKYEQKRK